MYICIDIYIYLYGNEKKTCSSTWDIFEHAAHARSGNDERRALARKRCVTPTRAPAQLARTCSKQEHVMGYRTCCGCFSMLRSDYIMLH